MKDLFLNESSIAVNFFCLDQACISISVGDIKKGHFYLRAINVGNFPAFLVTFFLLGHKGESTLVIIQHNTWPNYLVVYS